MKWLLFPVLLIAGTLSAQTIYVVRHGEKAVPAADATAKEKSDPPLSEAGLQRADRLALLLNQQPVTEIWSTPYIRTRATVAKLSERWQVPVQTYQPHPDSTRQMLRHVLQRADGVVVIAGHSNTVDDIVNSITGEASLPGDLDESEYDNLFVLRKEGGKFVLERRKY